MSTTRSQKRRNDQQEGDRNVSEGFVSPIVMENPCSSNQDVEVTGPSRPKSPRIENSPLESLRASLKEEITSEIKNLLIESQKEMLKLLKPETRENARDNFDEETENETRSFYTPTKSVRINSTQNDPKHVCRNSSSFFIDGATTNGSLPLQSVTTAETGIGFIKNYFHHHVINVQAVKLFYCCSRRFRESLFVSFFSVLASYKFAKISILESFVVAFALLKSTKLPLYPCTSTYNYSIFSPFDLETTHKSSNAF